MDNKNKNATRFIAAYNRLDQGLRDIYSIKRTLTFSDMIRKVASVNTVVSKFEEDLIDYGRLRNAIVHRSGDEIIAEPHIEVVEKLEKIARIINTPPKVIECLRPRKVFTVDGDTSLRQVGLEMAKSGYSVVPVYISGTLVGVINRKMIIDGIGKFIEQGRDIDDSINEPVSKCLDIFNETSHYEVAPIGLTIETLMYMFQQNRKLSSVILTENGNYTEPAKVVIVSADLIDLNTILDNY
ncbi:MAG: CBS domain-containing protein [Clostridia bacterium]|nr:CBS domain-containing protein [Clostridia bacterium]MBR2390960.1 CBS domain-containing protein [Clostridia bacterium]